MRRHRPAAVTLKVSTVLLLALSSELERPARRVRQLADWATDAERWLEVNTNDGPAATRKEVLGVLDELSRLVGQALPDAAAQVRDLTVKNAELQAEVTRSEAALALLTTSIVSEEFAAFQPDGDED